MGKSNSTDTRIRPCDGEHNSKGFEPGTSYCGSEKCGAAKQCTNRVCNQCSFPVKSKAGIKNICKWCHVAN